MYIPSELYVEDETLLKREFVDKSTANEKSKILTI